MAINALKKITVKDVMKGKPERHKVAVPRVVDGKPVLGDDGKQIIDEVSQVKPQDVCVIFGRAHSHETGSTSFGPYVTYIGSFEARRVKDGEVFQSTRIIMPPIADGIALETFMNVKAEDATAQVDFAFVVGVEHDPRGAEGYKFTCKPIQTGQNAHDPLGELRAGLSSQFAAALPPGVAATLGLAAPDEMALIGAGSTTSSEKEPEAAPATAKEAKKS